MQIIYLSEKKNYLNLYISFYKCFLYKKINFIYYNYVIHRYLFKKLYILISMVTFFLKGRKFNIYKFFIRWFLIHKNLTNIYQVLLLMYNIIN